jgi:hypothetical protein
MIADAGTMDPDRVLWHLDNWAEWQATRRGDYGRGYPSRASGGMGQVQSRDFESMVATADAHCAAAVEAILESCTVVERCSVHHFHLGAVFRFPRIGRGAELAYEHAREKIGRALLQRGIP